MENKQTSPLNKMEFVNQGSIEMYQTKDSTFTPPYKVERSVSQLERLTPEIPLFNDQQNSDDDDQMMKDETEDSTMTVTSDQLYERIFELADTLQREINTNSNINSNISQVKPFQQFTTQQLEGVETALKHKSINKEKDLTAVNDHDKNHNEDEQSVMKEKIRKALGKMKRLDSKLTELTKKEKEIKKQRKLMEEFQPADHESTLSDHHFSDGMVPVFPTQPQFKNDLQIECLESNTTEETSTAQYDQTDAQSSTVNSEENPHHTKKWNSQTDCNNDFITRNKELAGQASQIIAMTETERKHLEMLLQQDDDEEKEENWKSKEKGFVFNETDLNRLATIDSELDRLVPTLTSRATSTISTMTDEVSTINSNSSFTQNQPQLQQQQQPGERVLLVLQENRTEHMRLTEIDKQLENINKIEEENREVSLTENQIQHLIEQCILEQQNDLYTKTH